jgi:hypothetical protein
MKKLPCFLLSQLLFAAISAQTLESGDILDKTANILNVMPSAAGNQYAAPSTEELDEWGAMLALLFSADYPAAYEAAGDLGYGLVEFADDTNDETYYVLEKLPASNNYWGTYMLNANACRENLVLAAPHPKFDINTGIQAAYCFKNIDAKFYMLAGTHRCNSTLPTSCSGTSSVCTGSSAPYRWSDMSHVTDAIWYKTIEFLNALNMTVVELHGFAKQPTDPYVIMSNGTRQTPAFDPIVVLRDNLEAVDPVLTFKIAHIDLDWNRLIGFQNTNGRHINNSANPCQTNAASTTGRFLHVEQERTRLRDDETGWHKMAVALSQTFSPVECGELVILPIELLFFEAAWKDEAVWLRWATASEQDNDYFEIERSADGRLFRSIATIPGAGDSYWRLDYQYQDRSPYPGFNYYRLKQTDFSGDVSYSHVVYVFHETSEPGGKVWASQNTIWVQLEQEGEARLLLSDPLGRIVFERRLTGSAAFAVPPTLSGVFFYQLEQSGRTQKRERLFLY